MTAEEKRFQRRRNLGTIAMNLKVIWDMSAQQTIGSIEEIGVE